MKLNPPKPVIPENDPYVNDLFDRAQFGDSLTSLFKNVDDSVVLSVDALWGDGKTTFAEMWIADLKRQGINCIYYDAFEHDYSDDPFVSFCAEIISLTASAFSDNEAIQKLKEDFKEKAKRVGGNALSLVARMGIKAISCGVISDDDMDKFSKITRDITTNSTIMSELVGQEIEDYNTNKKNLAEFKQNLSELGSAVKEEQDFPLLIIIDELDRCKPDFALALIERIKHLFSTPNVSFLLLVNMEQMERYVETVYGEKVDARNYLHKFITLSTKLPKDIQDKRINDYSKYIGQMKTHYGLQGRNREIDNVLEVLFHCYNCNLREIERCFATLSLYYSQLTENNLTHQAVIPFLAFLKLRFADTFDKLSANLLSYEELSKSIDIKQFCQSGYDYFPGDWIATTFEYCLMNDERYENLDENDANLQDLRWLLRRPMDRKEIIPFFCSDLNKFNIVMDESKL